MWPVENSVCGSLWLNVRDMDCVLTSYEPGANTQGDNTPTDTLNRGDALPPAAVKYLYLDGMELLLRDADIMRAVARFGSLTTSQIEEMFFLDLKSRTPVTRALKRLTDQGMLARVSVRLPSNRTGGSPMGCFQIGRTSWSSFNTGRYRPVRDQMKLMHTLSVADTYIAIKKAERERWLDVLKVGIDQHDAWVMVAGADLRPDLYVELGLREKRERVVLWIEVDMGSERQKQILEKVDRYKYALEHSAEYPLDVFPSVLFLACDEARADELRTILRRAPQTPEGFISVALLASFPQLLR